jgi:hypothetical protein
VNPCGVASRQRAGRASRVAVEEGHPSEEDAGGHPEEPCGNHDRSKPTRGVTLLQVPDVRAKRADDDFVDRYAVAMSLDA